MYRFIVLYVCIYVAPWTCEARHFVPLYVPTCSGMTIKLNLNLNLNLFDSATDEEGLRCCAVETNRAGHVIAYIYIYIMKL